MRFSVKGGLALPSLQDEAGDYRHCLLIEAPPGEKASIEDRKRVGRLRTTSLTHRQVAHSDLRKRPCP